MRGAGHQQDAPHARRAQQVHRVAGILKGVEGLIVHPARLNAEIARQRGAHRGRFSVIAGDQNGQAGCAREISAVGEPLQL